MRCAILAMSLLVATAGLAAQNEETGTTTQEKNAAILKGFTPDAHPSGAESGLQMFGAGMFPCDQEKQNELVHNTCLQARQAYYEYYAKGLARRTSVYEWNNFSTKVIFFVVLSLVAVGVFFSWKQFFGTKIPAGTHQSDGEKRYEGKPPTRFEQAEQQLLTELEMGLGGIKVKSPILGVILLTMSLMFFYLYLKFVYPVNTSF